MSCPSGDAENVLHGAVVLDTSLCCFVTATMMIGLSNNNGPHRVQLSCVLFFTLALLAMLKMETESGEGVKDSAKDVAL